MTPADWDFHQSWHRHFPEPRNLLRTLRVLAVILAWVMGVAAVAAAYGMYLQPRDGWPVIVSKDYLVGGWVGGWVGGVGWAGGWVGGWVRILSALRTAARPTCRPRRRKLTQPRPPAPRDGTRTQPLFTLSSFAVALLITFRTNSAYSRWWEVSCKQCTQTLTL